MRSSSGSGCKTATVAGVLLVAATIAVSPATAQEEGGVVEVFSYWTAGGEKEGLDAAETVFAQQHPNVAIQNTTIAGGAGVNANLVLASRMGGGNPPDTFQIHGGAELIENWVKGNDLTQPLTDLFEAEGLNDKFPADIVELVSHEGAPYSVPLGVHRNGVLWFNKAIFEANGLSAPTTWDEFFTVADTLQAAGVTPLALGDRDAWTALNLFEQILLSQLGPDDYRGIWAGTVPWTDERVTAALEIFGRALDYTNADHSTLVWNEASQLLVDGTAAMNVMGDWAKGYFTSLGWTPDVEFGWAPVPGTDGTFTVVTDSFAQPREAANPENAQLWLATLASVEAQDAFNPLKGSIPARVDSDRSKYDVYSTVAMDDFAADALVPSQANGPATVDAFRQGITDAISVFVTSRDVAATQAAIDASCHSTGACPG
jgi:glucose/mannose transport system substrate-binding protein